MATVSGTYLVEACALIEGFMAGLDTSETKCECCSRTSFVNLNEARTHTELSGVVEKLHRRAAWYLEQENTQAST